MTLPPEPTAPMAVDGTCHCGAIAFEAVIDTDRVGVCHCTDCQRLSGAPFRASAPARVDTFRILAGEPRTYVKLADSGIRRVQTFCGDCGSPIYSAMADNPVAYNIRLGVVTQRAALVPKHQIWCDSAIPWAKDVLPYPARPKG